jgi:uncharacterized protein (TIGR02145 family)
MIRCGDDVAGPEEPGPVTVTDKDGNVYATVQIGSQTWTVENLRTTTYSDGSPIPHVTESTEWAALTNPGFCYYNNTTDADSIEKFGALYNWHAVSTDKLAPAGWHVPDTSDWNTLADYLIANRHNYDETAEGNKIAKALAMETDWQEYTTPGSIGADRSSNNSSGFSAVPGGFRDNNGYFNFSIGKNCYLWSSSQVGATEAVHRYLYYDFVDFRSYVNPQSWGMSVRLVRD